MRPSQPRKPFSDAYDKLEIYREFEALHKRINEVFKVGPIELDRTLTPATETGNKTINKIAGSVRMAAAASSVVVTNSFVDEDSIILCVIRTNDTTAILKNVVAANGSFTIRTTAAVTAETEIAFLVTG